MNIADIVVFSLIAVMLFFVIRGLIKHKGGCSCGCGGCSKCGTGSSCSCGDSSADTPKKTK